MSSRLKSLILVVSAILPAYGQSAAPSVSQVLMYSGTAQPGTGVPAGTIPAVYTYKGSPVYTSNYLNGPADPLYPLFVKGTQDPTNFTPSANLAALNQALSASIATALSVIPLASPASGVVYRIDPTTKEELPVSSTLGPIFTERAETIGKGRFYLGFSHEDFHFTQFNGQSLNSLSVFYTGGDTSNVQRSTTNTVPFTTVPATVAIGMDVRLTQDIAFLTYGATDRFDISVGLPMVHAAMSSRTFNGLIYAGTGFGAGSGWWCANTFTPGSPLLELPVIGQANQSKTGFGDLLLRVKGTLISKPNAVLAIGADVRFPTGDAENYLGSGATSVKPFMALSLYSKRFNNGVVLSPHVDAGWQLASKSILGATLQPTAASSTPLTLTPPFAFGPKDYLPDVFSWAAGAEIAFGHRNTFIADVLGDEIGLIHGIWNTTSTTVQNLQLPTGPNGTPPGFAGGPAAPPTPTTQSVTGLVPGGRVSYAQTKLSLGYKVRLAGNLTANVNFLVRLDNNGLVARMTPLYGIGYTF